MRSNANLTNVMEREHEADDATREILIAVRRTFITPFDRGDIKDLTTSMDNAIDMMQKTAKAVVLFEIKTFTPEMKAMGDIIVECAILVQEAVPLLSRDQHACRADQRHRRERFRISKARPTRCTSAA